VGLDAGGVTRAHLLGHGHLATIVTANGTGVTTWRGLDVNRFREDGRLDPLGTFIYVTNRTLNRSWSVGAEPMRTAASSYRATFSVDRVELHRLDGDVETTTEIVVSPEQCLEVRRVTLTNHGRRACVIELTTYTEVVLAPRAADVAHRAFSNMFVEIEECSEIDGLIATRRVRSASELQPWAVQTLVVESGDWSPAHFQSNRTHFVGRGRDLERQTV
jgi:cellobiose phosphorylase